MDNSSLLAFLSFLPIIIILMVIYTKDKRKEPFSLLILLFLLGIASCFLVMGVSTFLKPILPFMNMSLSEMDFLNILLYAFIGIALIEEICKWVMVYFVGYHSKHFDELYDSNGSIRTAIIRAISAIPGHACNAVFMGYYLSLAKYFHSKGRKDIERNNIILSIIIPTVLHGIYDFCIMSRSTIFIIVFVIFIVYLDIISIKKVKDISTSNKNIGKELTFCPTCGLKLINGYCRNCGRKQE